MKQTYSYILKKPNGGLIQGTRRATSKHEASNKLPNRIKQPYRLVTIQPY